MTRWQQGGWPTLDAALIAFRQVLHETVAEWTRQWDDTPFDYLLVNEKYNDFLEWLIEPAPWAHSTIGFAVVPDGRGNFRFVAIGSFAAVPFSTERALHGDFTPPCAPYDPNKPFAGLTT